MRIIKSASDAWTKPAGRAGSSLDSTRVSQLGPHEREEQSARRRNWPGTLIIVLLVSAVLLVPCFWQSRIQAGDLSSHVYNAWLTILIEQGQVQGLFLADQWTNVLFDLMLTGLFKAFGPAVAQRIAVSVCVLVFAWGAFMFARSVARKRPWHMLPCIAMLAYGWVFHTGLFNFYLSTGICLWAVAVSWKRTRHTFIIAALLLALAWLAHALPVAWAAGAIVYQSISHRVTPGRRILLVLGGLCMLGIFGTLLKQLFPTLGGTHQWLLMTGADQVLVFGTNHFFIFYLGLLLFWGALLARLESATSWRSIAAEAPFHLCLFAAAGVALIPTRIDLPGFNHALVGIAERMSLIAGVSVCAWLSSARPGMAERVGVILLSLAFFGFLYFDTRKANELEDRVERAASRVPRYQRVIGGVCYAPGRVNPLTHVMDRVCVGRCFSYGNYEPSTGQFRVRPVPGNPVVVSEYGDSWEIQSGAYVVKPQDVPLYQVYSCAGPGSELCVRGLSAGESIKTDCAAEAGHGS